MVPMNEVVAGYRGKGVGIYYVQDAPGAAWTKTVATDIACIGSAAANLKWYENLGGR